MAAFFCVVLSCVSRVLAMIDFPVQGILPKYPYSFIKSDFISWSSGCIDVVGYQRFGTPCCVPDKLSP
jgi:hypothetical protein